MKIYYLGGLKTLTLYLTKLHEKRKFFSANNEDFSFQIKATASGGAIGHHQKGGAMWAAGPT